MKKKYVWSRKLNRYVLRRSLRLKMRATLRGKEESHKLDKRGSTPRPASYIVKPKRPVNKFRPPEMKDGIRTRGVKYHRIQEASDFVRPNFQQRLPELPIKEEVVTLPPKPIHIAPKPPEPTPMDTFKQMVKDGRLHQADLDAYLRNEQKN